LKQGLFTNLGRALAVCLLAALSAAAQEPAEKLSLRLVLHEGGTPAYMDVGDKGFSLSGSVDTLRRLDTAALAQSGERWRTIHYSVWRRGERVVIKLRLSREIDEAVDEIELGEYEVGVGEEQRVSALEQYGFEPIKLGVVRGAPIRLSPPPVVNLTHSIAVLGVEVSAGRPDLEVTLKNTSSRSVMAVELRLMKGGMVRGYRPDSNRGERPWALPDGVWKAKLSIVAAADKTSAEGHHFEQPDEIVIASALFSDGGYEGEASFAVGQAAWCTGRRIQAGRALPLVRDYEEQKGVSLTGFAKELRRKASALPQAADDAVVDEFMAKYPELSAVERERIKEAIDGGLKDVRRGLVSGLKPYTEDSRVQDATHQFRKWLAYVRESYERVLSFN
jgi:hypothetical protein